MKAVDSDVDNAVSGVECGGTMLVRDHGPAHLAPCCAGLAPGFKLPQCVECVDQDQEEAGHRHSRCWAANGLVDIIRRACYLRYHSDLHDTLIAQLFE